MRHRVRIEVPVSTSTATGEPVQDWVLLSERWAAVEPLVGRELFAAQERDAKIPTRFRMRFVEGVQPRMRLVWDARQFDITAVQQVRGLRHELVVMGDELVQEPTVPESSQAGSIHVLTLAELADPIFGDGFGTIPLGAYGVYLGDTLVEIRW